MTSTAPTGSPVDFVSLRSAGTHQRSWVFPLGNTGYQFVAQGNKLAARVSLMISYSLSRACRFLLEQPNGSMAPAHPRLEPLMREHKIWKQGIWGGAWADDKTKTTPKRHLLFSNDLRLLRELGIASARLSKEELNSMCGEPLTKRTKHADGSTSWTGDKEKLRASQWGPQLICCHMFSSTITQLCSIIDLLILIHHGRAYHSQFGGHLAQMTLQMKKPDWEVRATTFLQLSYYCLYMCN